jgi:hypothetical protein
MLFDIGRTFFCLIYMKIAYLHHETSFQLYTGLRNYDVDAEQWKKYLEN